jgi:hypothetical protein
VKESEENMQQPVSRGEKLNLFSMTFEQLTTAREIASASGVSKRQVLREMNDGKFVDPVLGPGFYMRGRNSKKVTVSAADAWQDEVTRRAAAMSPQVRVSINNGRVEPALIGQVYKRALKNRRCVKLRPEPASYELLRLRDVERWLGVPRDYVELLEKEGMITPFRKCQRAKAWYATRQLCSVFQLPLPDMPKAPRTQLIRRFDALDWLGVSPAEFESWVRYGVISARRPHSSKGKAHYSVSEIKRNVLCVAK